MIEVIGYGEISVFPDVFQLQIGVRSQPTDKVEIAQYEVSKKINQIISAFQKEGIQEDRIRTISYFIQPIYDYQNGQNHFIGSSVEHILQVTSTDINKIGHLLDVGITYGGNVVNGISYKLKDEKEYYEQALVYALKDANKKAIKIATELGVNLNLSPKEVKEEGTGGYDVKLYAMSSPTVIPGNIEIRGQVRVKYEYSIE